MSTRTWCGTRRETCSHHLQHAAARHRGGITVCQSVTCTLTPTRTHPHTPHSYECRRSEKDFLAQPHGHRKGHSRCGRGRAAVVAQSERTVLSPHAVRNARGTRSPWLRKVGRCVMCTCAQEQTNVLHCKTDTQRRLCWFVRADQLRYTRARGWLPPASRCTCSPLTVHPERQRCR